MKTFQGHVSGKFDILNDSVTFSSKTLTIQSKDKAILACRKYAARLIPYPKAIANGLGAYTEIPITATTDCASKLLKPLVGTTTKIYIG